MTGGTPQQPQPRQQQQLSSGGPLLSGSGVPGSGLAPPSFPFSVSSLASAGAVSSPQGAASKPSPPQLPPPASSASPSSGQQQQLLQQLLLQQQQQQQQQQKKQSPLSHPQPSLPVSVRPAEPIQVSGTTIGGLRFAPGYLSHAQQPAPPPVTGAPISGQQLTSAPRVGSTKTMGLTSSPVAPTPATAAALVSQLPSVSGVFQPSMPPPSQVTQPQLAVKPLHSSTPLAHPAGLHSQPRPLPPHLLPAAATVAPPIPNSAAVVQPSPLLSGTSPLSVRMAAPKPAGIAQGGGPGVAAATGQPRPLAPSTVSPQMVGVRPPSQMAGVRPPTGPLVQNQPPPAYGYGASPPTSVGGVSAPPRTAHHAPPPPSSADDTEVCILLE